MSFIEKVSKFGGKVVDSASKTAETIADKSKAAAEKAKLNRKISAEQTKITQAYIKIGKQFYKSNLSVPPEGYEDSFKEIVDSESMIEALNAQIEEINSSYICYSCGGKIQKDQEFCHLCGARIKNDDDVVVTTAETVAVSEPENSENEPKSE